MTPRETQPAPNGPWKRDQHGVPGGRLTTEQAATKNPPPGTLTSRAP